MPDDPDILDVTTSDGKFRVVKRAHGGLELFEGTDAPLRRMRHPEVIEALAIDLARRRAETPAP